MYYRLDGKTGQPVPEENVLTWARWFERADRQVAETRLTPQVRVSTVFLGSDLWPSPGLPPLIWETMVFGGPYDGHQVRYRGRTLALQGHALIVLNLADGLDPDAERPVERTLETLKQFTVPVRKVNRAIDLEGVTP